jgi:hypothetical protein
VIQLAPPNAQGARELLEMLAHAPRWLDARATRALRACAAATAADRALTAKPGPHRLDVTV